MKHPHPLATVPRPGARRARRWKAVGVFVLLLLAGADGLIAGTLEVRPWAQVLVLSVGLAGLVWPHRPSLLADPIWTAIPAIVSLATSSVCSLAGASAAFGPGEVTILMYLLLVAVRTNPGRWAVVGGLLNAGAVLALPLRSASSHPYDTDSTSAFIIFWVFTLVVPIVVGLAGYLRSLDEHRRHSIVETRRAERLEMSAHLHDFVAHHVTGILVQAQLGRMLAHTDPDRVGLIMEGIEEAAGKALTSMRGTVSLLRDPETGTYGTERVALRPVPDLTTIAELIEDFSAPSGCSVTLTQDRSVPPDLRYEIQAAAYRIVQESLTNVLRHAGDATQVTVDLSHEGRNLRIAVRDDGRGANSGAAAGGDGGFGLLGLSELASTLGGQLHAGPRVGGGWEVMAALPGGKAVRR